MKSIYERESLCELHFCEAGQCWHLWTNEDHPIIFATKDDFTAGMNILAIVARLYPKVKIFTFILMSNHIHIVVAGDECTIREFFSMFKKLLAQYFAGLGHGQKTRLVDLTGFECNLRLIESLMDMRNVIAYDNRNGYLVSPDETPFSYPWGANRYYFNPDARYVAEASNDYLKKADRREIVHSHISDGVAPIKKAFGHACPLDFCAISEGESMFQGAAAYFHHISKNVESYKKIAQEISERIFYTDQELNSIVFSMAINKYKLPINSLDRNAKTELARTLHYNYNAGNKQIARMLNLPISIVDTLFP